MSPSAYNVHCHFPAHLWNVSVKTPTNYDENEQCLSIARGPESLAGARVTVVARKDAGIDPDQAEAVGASSARQASTKIPVDGLFGIYNLLSGPFVAVISRSKLRCGGGAARAGGVLVQNVVHRRRIWNPRQEYFFVNCMRFFFPRLLWQHASFDITADVFSRFSDSHARTHGAHLPSACFCFDSLAAGYSPPHHPPVSSSPVASSGGGAPQVREPRPPGRVPAGVQGATDPGARGTSSSGRRPGEGGS